MLAGREAATAILQNALDLLLKPRIRPGGPLQQAPYTPIRLVGPRGSGKTTLLNWAKWRAEEKGIRVVTWERLKENGGPETSLHDLMFSLAGGEDSFLDRVKHVGLGLMDKASFGVGLGKAGRNYERVMARALEKRPLLLLLDEVQHYDINPLATVIQKNQALLGASQPLAMVLAGTPGLETLLRRAEASFIFRSEKIYLAKLASEDTRKALLAPFAKHDVKVPPEALEAMAQQTDDYPYFAQLVGKAVWNAMAQAGRKDIDVELVANAAEKRGRSGKIFTGQISARCETAALCHTPVR